MDGRVRIFNGIISKIGDNKFFRLVKHELVFVHILRINQLRRYFLALYENFNRDRAFTQRWDKSEFVKKIDIFQFIFIDENVLDKFTPPNESGITNPALKFGKNQNPSIVGAVSANQIRSDLGDDIAHLDLPITQFIVLFLERDGVMPGQ